MTIRTTRVCDQCGANLNEDNGADRFFLHLSEQKMPARDGIRLDVFITPELDTDKDFCGMRCLKQWVAQQ